MQQGIQPMQAKGVLAALQVAVKHAGHGHIQIAALHKPTLLTKC